MTPTAPRGTRVVLGSASSARLRVLRDAGIDPVVRVSEVDEDEILRRLAVADTPPTEVVTALAAAKAQTVVEQLLGEPDAARDTVVIGCDSMLLLDGALTGKPHRPDVAREHWRRARGHSGELLTGHCVIRTVEGRESGRAQACVGTTVRFAEIDDAAIDAYVATGEPLEVAGGFTLDGRGGWFVDGIDGDPSSVLGIGLPALRRLFADVGLGVAELW